MQKNKISLPGTKLTQNSSNSGQAAEIFEFFDKSQVIRHTVLTTSRPGSKRPKRLISHSSLMPL